MFGDIKGDEVKDVVVFKNTYFPLGFEAPNAGYTVSVLGLFRYHMFNGYKYSNSVL